MQLSLLCGLALLSWITWTACWMMQKSQNSYLQQWLLHQWHYLAILLDMEAPPEPRDCILCGVDGIFQQNTSTGHSTGWNNGMEYSLRNHPCSWLVWYCMLGGKHCPTSGCSNDEITTEEEDDWEDVDQDGCPPNLQALKN
ncbi:hypothetical protein F5J12DRAFT_782000 [Pisolithus orientalis]|uniref:uncharacterized protein n=1 Tax=Pisolithus orientalis TaxID=936130 RepID=UPI0022259994|nr:uncharacterized protein F5J12DRAFT_782000 [Pisolithus orientalis]KAI6009460.1 hypothetical protein F5J12DRAFT_782000 [Pisolithus orientalis]